MQLFSGREVYGKTLNIKQVKSIPFDGPKPNPNPPQQQLGQMRVNPSGQRELINK